MKSVKIGIQGGKGSFSEEAAQAFAVNHGIDNQEILYLISSKAAWSAEILSFLPLKIESPYAAL